MGCGKLVSMIISVAISATQYILIHYTKLIYTAPIKKSLQSALTNKKSRQNTDVIMSIAHILPL